MSSTEEYLIPTFDKNKSRKRDSYNDEKGVLDSFIREEETPSVRSENSGKN